MALTPYIFLCVLCCGTFGHNWENYQINDDIDSILKGSMNDPLEVHEHVRKKREIQFQTVEEVVKFLLKEVDTLWTRIKLLEKDNAIFQQTIAIVAKITDKKLSQYSCGCLKHMLQSEGVVPCEMTTVITSPPSTVSVTPTLASDQCPESVQYQDVPEIAPLVPGVMAVSYYGEHFYRYVFGNSSTDIVTSDRKLTYALTFDPVDEKLIWSSFTPSAIYSSQVDGTNFTTLARDILSYGLAIDPSKKLLFLTTVTPGHAVAVMYTDGSGYRVIARIGKYGRPSRLTLDYKNEMAFVAFRSRIVKVSYNGSEQSVLLRGKYITCLTFDNINAVLYYADRIIINKVKDTTTDNAKANRVIRFKPKTGSYPSDLFLDGSDIYIGYKFKTTVDVLSLDNKTVKTVANVDGEFTSVCVMRSIYSRGLNGD